MSTNGMTARTALEMRAKSSTQSVATRFVDYVYTLFRVHSERQRLMALDDHMLKDIGLSRGDAYAEASRSMFDIPGHGLDRH